MGFYPGQVPTRRPLSASAPPEPKQFLLLDSLFLQGMKANQCELTIKAR